MNRARFTFPSGAFAMGGFRCLGRYGCRHQQCHGSHGGQRRLLPQLQSGQHRFPRCPPARPITCKAKILAQSALARQSAGWRGSRRDRHRHRAPWLPRLPTALSKFLLLDRQHAQSGVLVTYEIQAVARRFRRRGPLVRTTPPPGSSARLIPPPEPGQTSVSMSPSDDSAAISTVRVEPLLLALDHSFALHRAAVVHTAARCSILNLRS